MLNKIKPKNEFDRNVITLMIGTTIAQVIPIAVSPILTRMYSPEEFGVLALFVAISSVFGTIVNGRYELAIMLPEKDEDAFNLCALGMLIALILSFMLLVVVTIFNRGITELIGNEEISFWLYFVPVSVFFIGLYNILTFFNNRMMNYRDIAQANIYKSIVLVIVQLSIGLLKNGAVGLVSGQVLSNVCANVRLLKNIFSSVDYKAHLSFYGMKKMALRYIRFPAFSIPGGLANILSTHAVNILISLFYSVSTLGHYSLTQRVLGMPTSLIGNAIGKVFLQEATKERQRTTKAVVAFDSTVKKLIVMALPVFSIMFFVVEDLFAFVFGENWRVAGVYTKILIPLFTIRFVVSPLSLINVSFERQKLGLAWQVGLLLLTILTIVYSNQIGISFEQFLIRFSAVTTFYYLFFFFLLHLVSRGKI